MVFSAPEKQEFSTVGEHRTWSKKIQLYNTIIKLIQIESIVINKQKQKVVENGSTISYNTIKENSCTIKLKEAKIGIEGIKEVSDIGIEN